MSISSLPACSFSSRRRWARFACAALVSLATVGCGSDDGCELTATCPVDQDSGVLGGDDESDDVSDGVSDDPSDVSDDPSDVSDDPSDDGPTPGPTGGSSTEDDPSVPDSPGGSLTILPPAPGPPADCAGPSCPDGGMPVSDTSDASAEPVDGSTCVGADCDAGACLSDECEMGCTPGTFDTTNFDEACFQ